MSYVKLENRPTTWWRVQASTIGRMIDTGWVVWSVCGSCFLVMPADLDWLAFRLGEDETMWNRHPQCRRLGCKALITFHGTPPTINRCMELKAEWPPEWRDSPPPPRRRCDPEPRTPPLEHPEQPQAARHGLMRD